MPVRSITGESTVLSQQGVKASAIVSLTDDSGGTPGNTIPAVTGSYVEATVETQMASLAGKINALITASRTAGVIAT